MKIVAIVQVRMSSSRLPGKALRDIHGRTMLARAVRRAGRSDLLDEVVVATTSQSIDDAIIAECERLGVPYFRGLEMDVLDRYYQAARAFLADIIVRITSDCPLIDPDIIDKVVQCFLDGGVDYASNTLKATYPRGLDVEVFSFWALEKAWQEASADYERVHVTPYIYQHPEIFRLLSVVSEEDFKSYRLTVDTQEDLNLIRIIYETINKDDNFSWRDALELMMAKPELAQINCHIRQKSLEEC